MYVGVFLGGLCTHTSLLGGQVGPYGKFLKKREFYASSLVLGWKYSSRGGFFVEPFTRIDSSGKFSVEKKDKVIFQLDDFLFVHFNRFDMFTCKRFFQNHLKALRIAFFLPQYDSIHKTFPGQEWISNFKPLSLVKKIRPLR